MKTKRLTLQRVRRIVWRRPCGLFAKNSATTSPGWKHLTAADIVSDMNELMAAAKSFNYQTLQDEWLDILDDRTRRMREAVAIPPSLLVKKTGASSF
jgi:hypothetical protein